MDLREPPSRSRSIDEGEASPSTASDVEERAERTIVCAACRHEVTRESERAVVNGASEHAFRNPAGIRFVVGCFARAPGVTGVGGWETVWTWFPGHAWSVVVCGGCGAHLGWAFAKEEATASFFGLVLDRLALST